MKRILCIVFALLLALPALAQPIGDVTDADTLGAIRFLQNAGVFDASYPDGRFRPNDTLTRAEFCRMAVSAAGVSDLAYHRTYTVFPDIRATNWALPYVNAAVRELKIVTGRADGTFGPGNAITLGEAATILVRLLGYGDEDVGANWPYSYLNRAQELGITAGLAHLPHRSAITRAQAATMFYTTLLSPVKGGGSTYIESKGAQWIKGVLVLSADGDAIVTTEGVFAAYTSEGIAPGRRGDLLVDEQGRVLRFQPSAQSGATVTLSEIYSDRVVDSHGETIRLAGNATLYLGDIVTTYGAGWPSLKAGAALSIYTGIGGVVDYLWTARPLAVHEAAETVSGALVMAVGVASPSGAQNTVMVDAGEETRWYAAAVALPSGVAGSRVHLTLDADGTIVAYALQNQTKRELTVALSMPDELRLADGTAMKIGGAVPIYFQDVALTYRSGWASIDENATVTAVYTATGNIDYLWTAKPATVREVERVEDAVLIRVWPQSATVCPVGGTAVTLGSELAFSDDLLCKPFLFAVDADNVIFAVRAKTAATVQTALVESAEAARVTLTEGGTVAVNANLPVFGGGGFVTWREAQPEIARYTAISFCRDEQNTLLYIVLGGADDDNTETAVIWDEIPAGGNPLRAIFRDLPDNYTLLKNGAEAALSDLRRYDVCVLNRAAGLVAVSDNRIGGALTGAAPGLAYATQITVGATTLEVVPGANAAFAQYAIGQQLTYLLTADNKVAGAVPTSVLRADMQGLIVEGGVLLHNGITLSGAPPTGLLPGDLVVCTAVNADGIVVNPLRESPGRAIDVFGRRMGETAILPSAVVYERAGAGAEHLRISFGSLSVANIAAAKVRHVGYDYAGRVNVLVLEDVTGDCYVYGRVASVSGERVTLATEHGPVDYSVPFGVTWSFGRDRVVGVAVRGDGSIIRAFACLSADSVTPADFDLKNRYVRIGNAWCKLEAEAVYIKALNQYRDIDSGVALFQTLTVYYDRDPALGGKARMVTGNG